MGLESPMKVTHQKTDIYSQKRHFLVIYHINNGKSVIDVFKVIKKI